MAYAALLSLSLILEQTLNRDHSYLILGEKQKLESLLQQINSLQQLLEKSSPKTNEKMECLEKEIIEASNLAEDIIESQVVKRFLLEVPASQRGESFTTFSENIEKVLEDISAAKDRMMQIMEEGRAIQDQQQPSSTAVSVESPRHGKDSTMVGLGDDLSEIRTQLYSGPRDLQTIALVGMGGIGKTTLAQKIYHDTCVKDHFDTCAWTTISQSYSIEKILQKILQDLVGHVIQPVDSADQEEKKKMIAESKERVYKNLKGKRFLCVMDDVWCTEVWDHIKLLFPNDNNGSRIMLTTRLDDVAAHFKPNLYLHRINLLSNDCSWKLLCERVFGNDSCPYELEKIGRTIVQHCKGLPLAIVVLAGLLSNITRTQEEWIEFEEILKGSMLASNDERFSKIWSLSYYHLPYHLRGCFLYLGVFPEDYDIQVSSLTRLWIAERLVKPLSFERAQNYLLDLINRNLIMVSKTSSTRKIKTCKIHDVLRDFCMTEAKKVAFFDVNDLSRCLSGPCVRRSILGGKSKGFFGYQQRSHSLTRSALSFNGLCIPPYLTSYFELLTVSHLAIGSPIPNLVNLRYIFATRDDMHSLKLIHRCRNLQTLVLRKSPKTSKCVQILPLELEIWKMAEVMHVQLDTTVNLPDPPSSKTNGENSIVVLENLQTLSMVYNFRCTDEVVKRIPNLVKLGIHYVDEPEDEPIDWGDYYLKNLFSLHKLEVLKFSFDISPPSFLKNITLPTTLQKLTITSGELPWEDMEVVGSLRKLQVLKLKDNAFSGPIWEPNEGEFENLEFLLLDNVYLEQWIVDSIHFRSLRHLVIKNRYDLEEIPSSIGGITTLESIELHACGNRLVQSAKAIQQEQDDEFLQVLVQKDHKLDIDEFYCVSRLSFFETEPFLNQLSCLTLSGCRLQGSDMSIVGYLSSLKVLKLKKDSFIERIWKLERGQFYNLEFLLLEDINIEVWIASSHNFPRLECLVLRRCKYLIEIPSSFREIQFLHSIVVQDCNHSLTRSAKLIQEQLDHRNEIPVTKRLTSVSKTRKDDLECFKHISSLEDNLSEHKPETLKEIGCVRNRDEMICCHFSSDGKLLAIAGGDGKVVLWNMDTLQVETTPEEHQMYITDVRFRPNSTQFLTSSEDQSIRLWDAANPSYCLQAYTRHTSHVRSLDFHPKKNDVFCFCDDDDQSGYWSINELSCARISQQRGGQVVRFQSITGQMLAAASRKGVSIFDVETDTQIHSFQGHTLYVWCLCWDQNGNLLASVSADRIKVWSLGSGECIHELNPNDGNEFWSCVFHPRYPSVLIVGGARGSLKLWNLAENKSMTIPAHGIDVYALEQSPVTGMVASTSSDGLTKLWK